MNNNRRDIILSRFDLACKRLSLIASSPNLQDRRVRVAIAQRRWNHDCRSLACDKSARGVLIGAVMWADELSASATRGQAAFAEKFTELTQGAQ